MKVRIFDQIRHFNLCMSFTGIDCSYSMCFMCKRKVAHNMRLTYCTLQNSKMLIRAILKRTTLSNHVFKQLTIGAGSITFCHNNAFILKMQDPNKIPHCCSLRRIQFSHRLCLPRDALQIQYNIVVDF